MKLFETTLATLSAGLIATSSLAAPTDILFILDGSGSMWGQIDGEAKISTAKSTLTQLMDDVPTQARVGLMTYGTTSKESCTDVQVLNALGTDRTAIKASISGITPLGKTPIQTALMQGITMLSGAEPADIQKSLVLVSDGIETCDGDPCTIAGLAKSSGVNMNIHVVGFDVDAETRAQLECIAENGGGQYFDAADTSGFQSAMQEAVILAQATVEPEPAPEPVPEGPVINEFFRDDFDGEDISDSWILTNPDPESYVVEDGALLMLSTSPNPFTEENGTNLITYTGDMPDGDWDAKVTFTGELTASGNVLHFGLWKDTDNFMASSFYANKAGSCWSTSASLTKTSKGEKEEVSRIYRAHVPSLGNCYTKLPKGPEDWSTILGDHETLPTTLTLSKRGRSYTASLEMEGLTLEDGTPFKVITDQFTALRAPGELTFGMGRYGNNATGEMLLLVDSVVINAVEE